MKQPVVLAIVMALLVARATSAQCVPSHGSPKEIVDQLWSMATRGDLLTDAGRNEASRSFFTDPTPSPGNKAVVVVSNQWGPAAERIKAETAEVEVGFWDEGEIDSTLRYARPKPTDAIKMAALYHLVLVPTYMMMYGPDGKTLVEKKATGCQDWAIKGSLGRPWTTVNTAIRYVLERRQKTADPAIKRNADQTLAELMKLH